MHAERLGDNASKIEYSKLLWKEGHHRKAIQNLRGAIESNAFQTYESNVTPSCFYLSGSIELGKPSQGP
jgi:hypothetical protein